MVHIKIKEYGQITKTELSVKTVLDKKEIKNVLSDKITVYTLVHHTAGYEPAGSVARYTKEKWSVKFELNGIPQGREFTNKEFADKEWSKVK